MQPYLSLALTMVKRHGHRVRIATHPDFKNQVLEVSSRLVSLTGPKDEPLDGRIEYFDIGGDPKALMAYMVKSKVVSWRADWMLI